MNKKIDFVALVSVYNANPNGDPLNGNRPRTDYDEIGEISDVCIKRKIRNRMMDMGKNIFVQSDDKTNDEFKSLKARAESKGIGKKGTKNEEAAKIACESWLDVRTFGQVLALKGSDGNVSIGIRGPVSIQLARSVDPVDIASIQITKSVNNEDGEKKSSDTMGMKYFVRYGLYVVKGSISSELAQKTGFNEEDAEVLKNCLATMFEGDSSSARPEGSMIVEKLYWFEQEDMKKIPPREIHNSVVIAKKEGVEMPKSYGDYVVEFKPLENHDVKTICEDNIVVVKIKNEV
jgi:CRISPR-associated protein Csd2